MTRMAPFGTPHERATLPNGEKVFVRDELGLAIDPAVWANPKCNICYGRGLLMKRFPVTNKQIAKIAEEGGEEQLAKVTVTNKEKGSGVHRTEAACGCARPRYAKVRKEILAKQKKDLAAAKKAEEALIPSG